MRSSLIRSIQLSVGVLVGVSLAYAGVPVASVSSAQAFNLDGTLVSNPGVNSWPLVINDDVATSTSGAVVNFHDGSRVDVGRNSRLQLTGSDENPRVILLAGKMSYNLAPGSHLTVLALNAQAPDTATTTGADQDKNKKKKGAAADTGEVPSDTLSKETKVLRVLLPIAFVGLGIATDAILQPGSASIR